MKKLSVSALVLALGTTLMAAPQSTPSSNPAPSAHTGKKAGKPNKPHVKHEKKNKTAAPAQHK